MRYSAALDYDDERFRRLAGVRKRTFQEMLALLTEARVRKKARGGRPNKLQIPEMLMMILEYLRGYRTCFHIGANYGLSESNAYETIRWVEDTLIRSGAFTLPGKKALIREAPDIEVILVDATETPIERPKKKQKRYYSGKKKRHTIKAQVVVDKQSGRIICTAFGAGRRHDFHLFKCSR